MKGSIKTYILWILFIIIIGCGGYFISWPTFDRILSSQVTLNKLNQEDNDKKKFLSSLEKIKETNEIENYINKWNTILPQDQDQADLFAIMIEDLAKQNEIPTDTVSYEKKSAKPTGITLAPEIEAISYTFSGNGSYEALNQFMTKIANLSRLNSIKHISIAPKEGGYTLNLTGEIFKIKGALNYENLTSFTFFEELKTKTKDFIEFIPPSTEEIPLGKTNPFTQ